MYITYFHVLFIVCFVDGIEKREKNRKVYSLALNGCYCITKLLRLLLLVGSFFC